MLKKVYWCSCKVPRYSYQILMEVELSVHIFEKYSKIKNFMKIRPVGAEVFHTIGRTDKHDEANSHFSKFYESVRKDR
jgi:hypothetical protein